MNDCNVHYNMAPSTDDFAEFVNDMTPHNHIMIHDSYPVCDIILRRFIQYIAQNGGWEIMAINYEPTGYGGTMR